VQGKGTLISVSPEHESLEGQQQGLKSQKQSVHERKGVQSVKCETPDSTGIF
jgi:hypothetical protein